MYVDEIILPNTIATIQLGVTDKLYFGVFYDTIVQCKYITLPEQHFTSINFANQLNTAMHVELNFNDCELSISYIVDQLTVSMSSSDKTSVTRDMMRWATFSDDILRHP